MSERSLECREEMSRASTKPASRVREAQERSLEKLKGRLAFCRQAGGERCLGTLHVAGGSTRCTTAGMSMVQPCSAHISMGAIQGASASAGVAQSNAASAAALRSFSREHRS